MARPILHQEQIEIDHTVVATIAARLLAKIPRTKQGMLDEEAVSHQSMVLWDEVGKEWKIWIRLEISWSGASGGKMGFSTENTELKHISIRLNDAEIAKNVGLITIDASGDEPNIRLGEAGDRLNAAEQAKMDKARYSLVYSLLLHELTHARDARMPEMGVDYPKSWDRATTEEKRKYVNEPAETRALLNQLVDDLKELRQAGDTAETLLAKSLWWRDYLGAYLEPSLRAQLMERVQKWLEEPE